MTAFRDAVFILSLLIGGHVMTQHFDQQVGSKSAEFFKQEFCVGEFAQGQQDCKDNKEPQSNNPHYLNGYGFQQQVKTLQGDRHE